MDRLLGCSCCRPVGGVKPLHPGKLIGLIERFVATYLAVCSPPPDAKSNRKRFQVDAGRGMALRTWVGSMSALTLAKRMALAPKALRTRSGTSSERRLA
jgi:hypothetical protein